MSNVKILAVFAENKLGQLARITRLLADANIDIRWMTIATSDTFGVCKCLVDQCERAFQELQQHGLTVSLLEVLAVELEDRPGGMYAVADCLAKHQVNVENSSGFSFNRRAGLLIETKDLDRGRLALEKNRFHLLTAEELLSR